MDVRRFGTVAHGTGRLIFRPAPTFTIEQYRRKKTRDDAKALDQAALGGSFRDFDAAVQQRADREHRRCRSKTSLRTAPAASPLLKSEATLAFNAAVDVPPRALQRRRQLARRRSRAATSAQHARQCPELRTVIDKYRDGHYNTSTSSLEQLHDKIEKPEPHFPEATSWFKGMWVECNYGGKGVWRPCQISSIRLDADAALVFDLRYPLMGGGFRGVERGVPERLLRWCPPHRHWYKGEPVVVNWNGRGTWYTAAVVRVHTDGSNSVDVQFDDGRTVGCVHGPRYVTRVPQQYIQQVRWYAGQPVLAQFRGRGLWYRAHITEVESNPNYDRFADPDKPTEPKERIDVQYEGLGGGEATESGMASMNLRPWLGTFEDRPNMSMPVSEADNFGSSIESVFVPSTAKPGAMDVAWFWGGCGGGRARQHARHQHARHQHDSLSSSAVHNMPQPHDADGLRTMGQRPRYQHQHQHEHQHEEKPPRSGLNADNVIATIRHPALLKQAYDMYSLDGHTRAQQTLEHGGMNHDARRKKRPTSASPARQQRSLKGILKKRPKTSLRRRAKRGAGGARFLSSAAIKAISGPDALVGVQRKGPGLERVTVKMRHKDLGTIGLTLQKFTDAIDHVGYRSGQKHIVFYVTVRPGSYEELSETVSKITGGNASVSLSTQEEIETKFVSAAGGPGTPSSSSSPMFSGTALPHETAPTRMERITFLNQARRGDMKKIARFLSRFPHSVGAAHPESGTSAILAATRGGHFIAVRYLLEHGADPTAKDAQGHCALQEARDQAAAKDKYFDPRLLGMLSKGVSVFMAAASGDLHRLKYLFAKARGKTFSRAAAQKVTTRKNRYGMTPLHLAVMHGHVETARFLSELGGAQQWREVNNVGQSPHDLARCVPGETGDALLEVAEAGRHHTVTLVPLFEGERRRWKGGKGGPR
jgi:hypothetical protein